MEKISLINQEILKTNEECTPYLIIYSDTALENYFKKVDSIASTVEGMESSVEYLDIIMNRIGKFLWKIKDNKLNEMEKLGWFFLPSFN